VSAEHLQQLLDHAAREMDRLTDWRERTSANLESRRYGYQDGRYDAWLHVAGYVQGMADRYDVKLDETRMNQALENGETK